MAAEGTTVSLAAMGKGARGTIQGVLDDPETLGESGDATVVMRLLEIGFVPGERVEVIAVARPGGDPMAVRVGGSCFALRRREAAAVQVRADVQAAP